VSTRSFRLIFSGYSATYSHSAEPDAEYSSDSAIR
jgi:hypothetical protein